jgi:hypothetical protein
MSTRRRIWSAVGLALAAVIPTAWAQAEPTVTLDPDHGEAGSTVTVTGTGLEDCGEFTTWTISFFWDDEPIGDPVETDGSEFEADLDVPADATAGDHSVLVAGACEAEGGGGDFTVELTFVVDAPVTPSTDPGGGVPGPTSPPPAGTTDDAEPTGLSSALPWLVGLLVLVAVVLLVALRPRRAAHRATRARVVARAHAGTYDVTGLRGPVVTVTAAILPGRGLTSLNEGRSR